MIGQRQQVVIAFSGESFRVADQREGAPTIFKTIPIAGIRVIERRSAQNDVFMRPYRNQRDTERFGRSEFYGWSEDKARQYAVPLRADFGAFVRNKNFNLD